VRRDQPHSASGALGSDGLPGKGGFVVAQRGQPPADAAAQDCQAAPLVEVAGATKEMNCTSKSSVKPSASAVACVASVLDMILTRNDCKEVMRKLHIDMLLCVARLHSGQTAFEVSGVISADDEEKGWPAVRILLKQWWPSWNLPAGAPPVLPIAGTAARVTNATRPTQSSKWVIGVDLTDINPAIGRCRVRAQSYFKLGALQSSIDVVRMAPSLKPPMGTTIASMLLVGTWDSSYCSFLMQLAAAGRAPAPRTAPLEAAACHKFETAGLAESAAKLPAAAVENDTVPAEPAVIATVELCQTEVWARRQEEVNVLLAAEKAQSATLHRARRIDARRRAVPPPGPAAQGASAPGRVAASSPAGGHGRRSATPRTRAAVRPGRARGTSVAPSILPLASLPGSGGNKRAALDPAFSILGDENKSAANKRPSGGSNALNTSSVSESPPLLPSTVPCVPGLPSLPISSPC